MTIGTVTATKDARGRIKGYVAAFGPMEGTGETKAAALEALAALAFDASRYASTRRYVHCADGTVYAITWTAFGAWNVDITAPGRAVPCSWGFSAGYSLDQILDRVHGNADAHGGVVHA